MLKKEGLIKCWIVPPNRLYHPVLPFRCNNSLLFCLRKTCAIEQNTASRCKHETIAERALVGTWVIYDVRRAVENIYQLVEVYEVYEYEVTQYDPQKNEGVIFIEYINTFLKLKTEGSRYPNWVRSPEDEDRYIHNFNASDGILSDKDAIRPNTAKRTFAKLCLNSMWGKLTERNTRTKSKMISGPRELY
jgi:hypothetical protein